MNGNKFVAALAGIALFLAAILAAPIAKSTTTYTFTPQYTEACTGANTKPLPSPWVSVGDGDDGQLPTYDELEVLSGACTTTVEVQDDGQAVLSSAAGVSTTNQYITYTIESLTGDDDSVVWTYLRSGPFLSPSYTLAIYGSLGSGKASWDVNEFETSGTLYDWGAHTGLTLAKGDTITFAVDGTTGHSPAGEWYVFHNGVLLGSGELSAPGLSEIIDSGTVGIQIDALGGVSSETGVTQIVAGKFTATD
jgi:hypothetical protein